MDGGERGRIGCLEVEYPLELDVICKTDCWESLRFWNDYDERKRYIDVPTSLGLPWSLDRSLPVQEPMTVHRGILLESLLLSTWGSMTIRRDIIYEHQVVELRPSLLNPSVRHFLPASTHPYVHRSVENIFTAIMPDPNLDPYTSKAENNNVTPQQKITGSDLGFRGFGLVD